MSRDNVEKICQNKMKLLISGKCLIFSPYADTIEVQDVAKILEIPGNTIHT